MDIGHCILVFRADHGVLRLSNAMLSMLMSRRPGQMQDDLVAVGYSVFEVAQWQRVL